MAGNQHCDEASQQEEGGSSTFTISLTFRAPAIEGEYLMEVAKSRWPVLAFIFCFDIACYLFRFLVKLFALSTSSGGEVQLLAAAVAVTSEIGPQLANMALLYVTISLLNRRSRKHGDTAARQEELLLSVLMAMAICNLLASLGAGAPQDYVYAAFFLICTSTFLKIRWWVGTLVLATPVVLLHMWQRGKHMHVALPPDAMVHILVAWAVGGLMAYLAEWYRRQMFSSQRMAAAAHQKELLEAQARMRAQRQLAAAQAQAAQRALVVARDKAAHEAQIEFMSLMCHEVRTPLNGCLASAEMLLETALCSEQRELANTIKVSGSILLSTVSNFLDFFKMEAGKTLDIVRTDVDLLQLVHDVHCIIEAMVGRNGEVRLLHPELTMSAESLGTDGIQHIVCDPDRVRGILLNLYTNAAKFTKQGHIGLRVQEVSGLHEPAPGDGYGKVTVTPAYQPLGRMSAAAPQNSQQSKAAQDADGVGDETGAGDAAGGEAWEAEANCQPAQETASAAPAASGRGPVDGVAVAWNGGGGAERSACQDGVDAEDALRPAAGGSEGAPEPTPEASTSASSEDSRWLLFEVMDTGVGITQEGLHALFKEYCQGTEDDMRKPRSKGGTGLGLSICSKQVAVLGGRIGAYSSPGKGSVFWFTVPLILPTNQQAGPPSSGMGPVQMASAFNSTTPTWPGTHMAGPQQDASGKGVAGDASQPGSHGAPPKAQGQASAPVSIILQPNPIASHQYAVSHAVGSVVRVASSQALAESSGAAPAGGLPDMSAVAASGRSMMGRGHRSLDMPPHFTMDTEQPSIAQLLQRRLANFPVQPMAPRFMEGGSPSDSGEMFQCVPRHGPGSHFSAGRGASYAPTPRPGSILATASDLGFADAYQELLPTHSMPTAQPFGGRDSGQSGGMQGAASPTPHMRMESWGMARVPSYSAAPHLMVGPGMQRSSVCSSPTPGGTPAYGQQGETYSNPNNVLPTDTLLPAGALAMSLHGQYINSPQHHSSSNSQQHSHSQHHSASHGQQFMPPPANPALAALRGRRVLLVEDNLINQTVARKMLAGLGMQCMVASNGLEAVKAVQSSMDGGGGGAFDVVLMDMMMPVMGGVDATRKIREFEAQQAAPPAADATTAAATAAGPQAPVLVGAAVTQQQLAAGAVAITPAAQQAGNATIPNGPDGAMALPEVAAAMVSRVPILAMTANASDRDREECRAAGMDGFLSKPVLKDRLADAILQVLAGGAWQAAGAASQR